MSYKLDDYQVLETLNDSKFGLRQRISRSDGRLFERRQLSYKHMDDALKEMMIYEINTLKKLRHPNIIQHEDAIVERKTCTLYLITEIGGSDSLQTLIDYHKRSRTFIKEDLIWNVLSQFCQALHSLSVVQNPYRSQIFHRCLKPSSVYFYFQTQKIKIGDFGLGLISNPYYMCPELQNLGLCNEKSDIWSMGCIIHEMCSLKPPFQVAGNDRNQITDWKLENVPKIYSRDLSSILRFILTPDEDTRPSPLMVLYHPIVKARRGGLKTVDGGSGVLETDFPLSSKENLTVIAEDSLEVSTADCSDLSLNQYLSMMGDQEASTTYIDDVDIQSIENGTAYPKATSSVLHVSPLPSPIGKKFSGSIGRPRSSLENSLVTRKATELCQTELHLQQWAKMLEEKEQELAHKEKRLHLWEIQIKEMFKQCGTMNRSNCSRISYTRQHSTNESSGVETDMDSTVSAYPSDSITEPTAVRMESSKIANPFSRYQTDRHVRFQQSENDSSRTRSESASNLFTEQRLHWLEMKRKKHHTTQSPPPALPPKMNGKLETDYIFMEEKSIPVSVPKSRTCKAPTSEIHSRFEMPKHLVKDKENYSGTLRLDTSRYCPPLPARSTGGKIADSKILTNELRAKLKSHNLPGLR
ncbi:hypothetical protein OUZ56_020849 [Daphnia magna]|uniref:non-specific serine/threonine protein kinase n=1 Tax=Daphnia magna TaxID=35525 RepID=A0ABQ9ZFT2_9CRUS|nr:hypothetical protein OUZ56_020849 [Daphnia magna]